MRTILSLIIILSAVSMVFTGSCGNTGIMIEKESKVTEEMMHIPDSGISEGFQTVTFALG